MITKLFKYQQLLQLMTLYENEFAIVCVTESVLANELGKSKEYVNECIQELYEKYFVIEKIKYGIYVIHHGNIDYLN